LRLVLQREIPDDEDLRRQWNGLVQQMERPEVFYTYEWALAVGRAYHASMAVLLWLAYEGSALVGVLALARGGGKRDEASFLAGNTADYCDFISHPQRRAEFVEAVLAELASLKMPTLRLANLPADSATLRALRVEGRNYGYSVYSRPAYFCAQVAFGSAEARREVKQSVERKQMLRRYMKAMGKLGPVSLSHLRSGDEITAALPDFSRTHVARFLTTGRISNLARPERREFLSELARLLSGPGWVTVTRLMVGERVVAWNYGFQFAGSWFWYQPTFDSELHQYSPGFCLLAKLVEEASETPTTDFVDFGLGAEGYKERMATGGRQTLYVIVTNSKVIYAKQALRYKAASRIKSIPRLEAWVRRGVGLRSSLRARVRANGMSGLPVWLWERIGAFFGRQEVLFFEWPKRAGDTGVNQPALTLQKIDLNLLALAAMHYVEDSETAAYLLRSAERLRAGGSIGWALISDAGVPVHFCWATEFEGFHMAELDHRLSAPTPSSMLLFDCWTPVAVRGRGYYGEAISEVASRLATDGKEPWIFSAVTNRSSISGVEKAGFQRKFSFIRKRFLFWSSVTQSPEFTAAKWSTGVSIAD
jgi:CelD/BcsL family acetyltransferase involved in cellulose biosynthesis